MQLRLIALAAAALLVPACGGGKPPAIEDLGGREKLSLYTLSVLRGARDGDRLTAQAMFSDSSSMLTLDMRFKIGAPTALESGEWKWARNNTTSGGAVRARSVTFLGGQSGPPSIGGVFELLGAGGAALYRVNIPVTEIRTRLPNRG
ncbi:MAG: hypothetical protein ACM336_11275 [Acidobacteriota bacterium]